MGGQPYSAFEYSGLYGIFLRLRFPASCRSCCDAATGRYTQTRCLGFFFRPPHPTAPHPIPYNPDRISLSSALTILFLLCDLTRLLMVFASASSRLARIRKMSSNSTCSGLLSKEHQGIRKCSFPVFQITVGAVARLIHRW